MGWREYVYTNPVQITLYHKTAYSLLMTENSGKTYIVGNGKFRRCNS